jgi:DNA primase/replicative DNA helicase
MSNASFFDEIKTRVDLVKYLTDVLNLDLVSDGPGRMAACCPFHEELTPSFKVEESRDGGWKRWKCWGACNESGTVLDAVMRNEGMEDVFEAARWLNDYYDLNLEANDEGWKRFRQNVDENRAEMAAHQEEMAKSESREGKRARSYLHKRGFSDETIEHFGLAVDAQRHRLTIPLFDKARQPVSIARRSLFDAWPCATCKREVKAKDVRRRQHQHKSLVEKGEAPDFDWKSCPYEDCQAPDKEAKISFLARQDPKYLLLKDFEKSKFLYHQYWARQPLIDRKQVDEIRGVFVVEGYADVWAAWQSGHLSAVSYNGALMSADQADKITTMAVEANKPVVLVPDTDTTGRLNVENNYRILRDANPNVIIQVVHGVEALKYQGKDGAELSCKDLGDVLEHHGAERVFELLIESRWPAEEWLIREIVGRKNAKTGEPFHLRSRQMQLIRGILSEVNDQIALDHVVPYLAHEWNIRPEDARGWFYSSLSASDVISAQHLIKDMWQAEYEALKFMIDENVVPFGYEEIDGCLPGGGARKGWLVMHLGKSGSGKALAATEPVLTPTGWVEIGQLRVGDQVIDPATGRPTHVTGVFPQGQRQLYRATFSDKTSVECDGEHLWQVELPLNHEQKVRTTLEIKAGMVPGTPERNPWIPLTAPVELGTGERLPTDPWLVGALLGSGSLVRPAETWFVPRSYLFASAANRLKLLQGLLDTDGFIGRGDADDPGTVVEFAAASKQLAEDLLFLVRSLGGVAEVERGYARSGDQEETRGIGPNRYCVRLALPAGISPFTLEAKAAMYSRQKLTRKRFVSIEPTRMAEAVCIKVAAPSELFITRDFTVTHNTMLSTALLANQAIHGVRAIIFSLEQKAGSLWERMACQVLDKTHDEVHELMQELWDRIEPELAGETPDIEKILAAGCPELAEVNELHKNLYIVDNVPSDSEQAVEMTPGKIQSIIREINMTKFESGPADVVYIDHLGILAVPEYAPNDVKSNDMAAPGFIMQELFKVCKATNVLMNVLQQLPKEVKPGIAPDYDSGRGGSKQTDYCDLIFTIWRPEMQIDLEDSEREILRGEYRLRLAKNRHGPNRTAHLYFDQDSLRIIPAANIPMPVSGLPGHKAETTEDPGAEMLIDASSTVAALDENEEPFRDSRALEEALGLVEDDGISADAGSEIISVQADPAALQTFDS